MKYIVENCPAVYIFKNGYSCNNLEFDEHKYCKDIPDCVMKQIVRLCKENQFFSYGAVMFGNGLSADVLNLLEIEEVKEQEAE